MTCLFWEADIHHHFHLIIGEDKLVEQNKLEQEFNSKKKIKNQPNSSEGKADTDASDFML